MKPAIIAHRGDSGHCPENTLAAFRSALEIGADGIELDIHASRDGRLVVCHDATVARTTGQEGRISEMDYDEIRALDAGSRFDARFAGERMPLLDEVLDLALGRGRLYIEVKEPGCEALVARLLRERRAVADSLIISFHADCLLALKKLLPDAALGFLTVRPDDLARVAEMGLPAISIACRPVTADFVEAAHRQGIMVSCWTVNEPEAMGSLARFGVDSITTDFPARCLSVLGKGG
ncbi:MAG: glycerophosphodiester phosphodiesterase [Armatimonadetes bacterium]|nr:glycerophosphodiester phosphodiesterase [Armatimonadota bacterium]